MVGHSAGEAVADVALRTLELLLLIAWLDNEGVLAVCRGTPNCVFLLFHCLVERELVVLVLLFLVEDHSNVLDVQLRLAPIARTLQREVTICDFSAQVHLQALPVEVADAAVQRVDVFLGEVAEANLAHHVVFLLSRSLLSQSLQVFLILSLDLLDDVLVQFLLLHRILHDLVEVFLVHSYRRRIVVHLGVVKRHFHEVFLDLLNHSLVSPAKILLVFLVECELFLHNHIFCLGLALDLRTVGKRQFLGGVGHLAKALSKACIVKFINKRV